MRFNRNVIIQDDIDRFLDPTRKNPKTLTQSPPGGATAAPGGVTVPTPDDYMTKLVKYIPVEVLGAYLFMASVVGSNVPDKHAHAIWLGALLIGVLVLTIPYDLFVINVVRPQQIAVSLVAIAIYVFAQGGWFATTSWYHQWYAGIIIPVFLLLIAILKLPPLPEDASAPAPRGAADPAPA